LSLENAQFFIIQAEILPRSSLVSGRLFGGITSLVQDGIEGRQEKKRYSQIHPNRWMHPFFSPYFCVWVGTSLVSDMHVMWEFRVQAVTLLDW